MDARGIDTDPGWVNRKFQALERKIEALRSERRAAATTIAEGGSLLVRGILTIAGRLDLTGTVSMKSEDGDELVRIGDMPHGDRGIAITRDSGDVAIQVRRLFDNSTEQSLDVYDKYGFPILAEEGIGSGPSRPLMHIPMQPVQATSGPLNVGPHGWEVETADTAWLTVFRARYSRHNQFGFFRVHVAASDTTTAAEVRVINEADGAHLGQFFAGPYTAVRPVGSTDHTELSMSGLVLPNVPWTTVTLGMQVRRTAGTGSLRVAVSESRGGF